MIVYTTAAMAINCQGRYCISSETPDEHQAACARTGCDSLILWQDGDSEDWRIAASLATERWNNRRSNPAS